MYERTCDVRGNPNDRDGEKDENADHEPSKRRYHIKLKQIVEAHRDGEKDENADHEPSKRRYHIKLKQIVEALI
ncbi:hypothetical protein QE152_g24474 [Popillia japonica]|uniref:Uncharacterized protein n=1 Tax=Popillia japonica TaxID=7064 RepID=A0AAW1KFJ1_POPJA